MRSSTARCHRACISVTVDAPKKYLTIFTDEAVEVIAQNRNRPFFLYLAYNAPHTPLQATRADYDALSDIKDHRLRVYAAMVKSLDRNIGRVLETLSSREITDDTLVIFTSDNGGTHVVGIDSLNAPFRGSKPTCWRRNTRTPVHALAAWSEAG
jgi:arylsulfatase A-like enzyme